MKKILEKDIEKRYRRAAEFIADFEAVLRHATAVNKVEGEIEVCLRAHFHLVFLHTHEEERALASLERIRKTMSSEKQAALSTWSETGGFREAGLPFISRDTIGNPLIVLDFEPAAGVYS